MKVNEFLESTTMWLSDSLAWDKGMKLSIYCIINHAMGTKIKFVVCFSVRFSTTKFLWSRLRLVVLRLKEAGRRTTWLPLYQLIQCTLVLRTTHSRKDVSCAVAMKVVHDTGSLSASSFLVPGALTDLVFLNIGLYTLITSCPAPKLLNVILCRFRDENFYCLTLLYEGVLISPYPDQEGNKFQRPNSGFIQHIPHETQYTSYPIALTFASHSKKLRTLSVQPGLRGSNDFRVGR